MGVRAVIDTLLPTESESSHGALIEGLMLSRLLDPHALSRIEDWMRASGVDVLLVRDVAKFNDDRIGRTLDALGDQVRDAQTALTTWVIVTFALRTLDAHYDVAPPRGASKSWLFFGSDAHAQAAANLFSLVASCKLHGLDPESCLADVIRVRAY